METPVLNIKVTKTAANGQVYDVVEYDEYAKNVKNYEDRTDIAVREDYKGESIILPYNGKYTGNPISPGIYNAGPIDFVKYPDSNSMDKYIQTEKNTISTSNTDNIATIIKSGELSKRLDEPFITTPDNITNIPIKDSDQPEMKCLKMALNAKHMDIDKYAARFGSNFPNDKRQLKNDSATLNIIKRYCDNCDMEAILILKDKEKDVPNPIGREIRVSLTEPNDFDAFTTAMNPPVSDDESDYSDD